MSYERRFPSKYELFRSSGIALSLLACLAASACGGSNSTTTSSTESAIAAASTATASIPTTTAVEPDAEESFPERTYFSESTNEDGSTFSTTIEVGRSVKVTESEQLPARFQALTSVCEIEAERDLLMPVAVTVKNTNAGTFSQSVAFMLTTSGFDFDAYGDLFVELAMGFSGGPACKSPGGGGNYSIGSVIFEGIEPQATRTIDAMAIVRNYFSPAFPDGQEHALKNLTLTLNQPGAEMTCFDGPGGRDGKFNFEGVRMGAGPWRISRCDDAAERAGTN